MAKTIKEYPAWQFFAKHNLPAYKGHWRMTERLAGQIQGLPDSRGILVCTNGIECFIELSDGSLYRGHYDWFVADKQSAERSEVSTRRSRKIEVVFEGF